MALDAPKLRLPSLKSLQAFEAAARHESFARAADELCVTPGAIAQQVKSLEDWLGFPLFERQNHGLRLLDEAREALPALVRGFDQLGLSVQQLRDQGPSRHIRIAALPCIAQLWLSPRLPALNAAFPALQISVTAMEEPPNFRREPYDLALFYLEEPCYPTALRLAEDSLFPICSPDIVDDNERDPATMLAGQTLLSDTVWERDWAKWMSLAGLDRKHFGGGSSFSLYSLALQAAIDGCGFLVGRKTLVKRAMDRGQLVAPFPQSLQCEDALTLIMPTELQSGHRLAPLVDWLKENAETV